MHAQWEDASRLVPTPAVDVQVMPEGPARVALRRRRYGAVRAAIGRAFGIRPFVTVHLDPVASHAWRLFDGRRDLRAVRSALQDDHPEEEDVAGRLGRLVGQLVSAGFLTLEASTS